MCLHTVYTYFHIVLGVKYYCASKKKTSSIWLLPLLCSQCSDWSVGHLCTFIYVIGPPKSWFRQRPCFHVWPVSNLWHHKSSKILCYCICNTKLTKMEGTKLVTLHFLANHDLLFKDMSWSEFHFELSQYRVRVKKWRWLGEMGHMLFNFTGAATSGDLAACECGVCNCKVR